jgi:hypothetical protein
MHRAEQGNNDLVSTNLIRLRQQLKLRLKFFPLFSITIPGCPQLLLRERLIRLFFNSGVFFVLFSGISLEKIAKLYCFCSGFVFRRF